MVIIAILLHLFGDPFIEVDRERLNIPLKKAEAMLFYIAVEGQVARDKLKYLFWGNKKEEQASNNLRNTIYLLRKALPECLVVNRRHIYLINYERDIDLIKEIADPSNTIRSYILEEPLIGLDMVNSVEFSEWLTLTRSSIKKQIVKYLKTRIIYCYESSLFEELTEALSTLLVFEPFDEDSVLELMEAYCNLGNTAKAVSLYSDFKKKIKSEVGILPSKRAEKFYEHLVVVRKGTIKQKQPGDFFVAEKLK